MAKLTNFYLNKQNGINLTRISKIFKKKNMIEREKKKWVINLEKKKIFESMKSEIIDLENNN